MRTYRQPSCRSASNRYTRRGVPPGSDVLERRVLLSAGDPDPSFGAGTGRALVDFGGTDHAAAIIVLGDGKVLAAGGGGAGGELTIARFTAAGSLDTSFGRGGPDGDGKVSIDFGGERDTGWAVELAELPGGRFLVVGTHEHDGTLWEELAVAAGPQTLRVRPQLGMVEEYVVVAGFNADGTLDTAFGKNGQVRPVFEPYEGNDYARSVTVQPDGRFLVTADLLMSGRAALARFNPDGTSDVSFGQLGYVFESTPDSEPAIGDVRVLGGGKVVVGTSSQGRYAVYRYNPDGTRDATFDGDGLATAAASGRSDHLAVQPDGKVVVAGTTLSGPGEPVRVNLLRFNPDGALDGTFGPGGADGDGVVSAALPGGPRATGLRIGRGGKLYVSLAGPRFAVARFNPDGTLDATFGPGGADGSGVATADFGPGGFGANSLAIQPDGRPVVAGSAAGNFALARFVVDDPGPDGDGNDQLSEAGRLRVGAGPLTQGISGRDVDLYAFAATVGQRVGFDVDPGPAGALDAYLRVFAPDGTELAANDNATAPGEAAGKSPYAEFTFSAAGTYFVGVSEARNRAYSPLSGTGDTSGAAATSGGFTLALTDRTPTRAADGNDQLTEASATSVGATLTGKSLSAHDVDVYRFTARARQRVGFDVDGASGDSPDTHVRLFAPDGAELAANDDAAGPGEAAAKASYLEFTFSAAGTYYVAVSGSPNRAYNPLTGGNDVAGGTGQYTLQLLDLPAGPPAPALSPPAGGLDRTFGAGDGIATTPFGGAGAFDNAGAQAVAVLPDGKIVVGGWAQVNNQGDFALVRYNPDGTLDTTFGRGGPDGDGRVTTDLAGGMDGARAIAVTPDGRILLAGVAGMPGSRLALARYNPDGTPDATFGAGAGHVASEVQLWEGGNMFVALLPGGKILAAGDQGSGPVLARFGSDGALDATFGTGGVLYPLLGELSVASPFAFALAADGKIVIGAGTNWRDTAVVARLMPDGSADPAFGQSGVMRWTGAAESSPVFKVAVQPDGGIVAATSGDALFRVDTAGRFDPAFGFGGSVHAGVSMIGSLTVLPGGEILVAGSGLRGPEVADGLSNVFSPANPSTGTVGTYTFGYKSSPTGPFTPFASYDDDDGDADLESHRGGTPVPAVTRNVGPNGVALGGQVLSPGEMALRPAADGSREYSVVRFTAAAAGDYDVYGDFRSAAAAVPGPDEPGATADVSLVLRGSRVEWSGQVSRSVADFNVRLMRLNAGDTLDFVVGNGGNGPPQDLTVLWATVRQLSHSVFDFAVARLTPDGRPDGTFDGTPSAPGDGLVFTDVGAIDGASAVAVQPDGKLVVAGATGPASYSTGPVRGAFVVARFRGDPRGTDGDADDQISESPRIGVGAARSGSISGARDVDMYDFVVTRPGQRIGFDVDVPSGGSLDSLLRVFTRSGAELVANENGAAPGESAGMSPYVEFTFSAPGEYWAAVSAAPNRAYDPISGGGDAAGGITGGYTLTLADRTPVSPADNDDQLLEAAAVEVSGAKVDAIAGASDVDVFSFTAVAGQRVGFDVDNILTSRLDSYLRVFAPDGSELAANDDAAAPGEAAGKAAYLEFRFSAAGTYFAVVSGSPNAASDVFAGGNDVAGSTGGYMLRLTDLSRPPDARTYESESGVLSGAVASARHPGFSGTGFADYTNAAGDFVEWAIEVPSAGRYELAFRYANGGAADRPLELRVDGGVLAAGASFAPTGTWGTWATATQSVLLTAGRHLVRLTATGSSGPNIDALTVRPAATQ